MLFFYLIMQSQSTHFLFEFGTEYLMFSFRKNNQIHLFFCLWVLVNGKNRGSKRIFRVTFIVFQLHPKASQTAEEWLARNSGAWLWLSWFFIGALFLPETRAWIALCSFVLFYTQNQYVLNLLILSHVCLHNAFKIHIDLLLCSKYYAKQWQQRPE